MLPHLQRLLLGGNAATGASKWQYPKTGVDYNVSTKSESASEGLPAGLRKDSLPKHVALIMDGSRRWCNSKGIDLTHAPFLDSSMNIALLCSKWGIPVATSLIFTTENWKRPKEINDRLFEHFESHLKDNLENYRRYGMRVSAIGEIYRLPKSLQEVVKDVEEATKNHSTLELIFGLSYGGRRDIIEATRRISEKVKAGVFGSQDIDDALMEKELWTNISGSPIPNPDLLIRTGGELRLTNFLLWQMAYTELYFTNIYPPDFGEDEFVKALHSFQNRERRYGNYTSTEH